MNTFSSLTDRTGALNSSELAHKAAKFTKKDLYNSTMESPLSYKQYFTPEAVVTNKAGKTYKSRGRFLDERKAPDRSDATKQPWSAGSLHGTDPFNTQVR